MGASKRDFQETRKDKKPSLQEVIWNTPPQTKEEYEQYLKSNQKTNQNGSK